MKHLIPLLAAITFLGAPAIWGQDTRDIIMGGTFSLHSEILNEDRTCLISLPDSYTQESSNKTYPVLILLDGYVHFKTAAGIVHFLSSDRNRNYMMPETIIIAIENVDRERDFTVTKIKTTRVNTMGGGRKFLAFMEKELIPYLDQHYRTEAHRTLVGHSLGGLLTLNAYMDENSLFNAYIAIDPSIWWDEQTMAAKVDSIPPSSFQKRLYIATANQGEANFERNKKRHDALFRLMKEKAGESLATRIAYFENESHRSVPLAAIYQGLRYLNEDKDQ
ncbi:MAG: alpha/beta hydrolase [Lewinellaceae bacterium]|nr:alpha/beta hydrolase [Lewinellaceae bacterium]